MKNLKWILILLVVQSVCIGIAFKKIISQPDDYVFCNQFDGIKNYFTLYTYVNDAAETDYFHFGMMNYPFGDVIFYTDNTPGFAIPYKIACSFFPALKNKVIPVFNFVALFNILLCTLLVYLILKRFTDSQLIAIVFAWALPWINPMALRLTSHINLSFSSIIVFWIWLLIKIYENKETVKAFFPYAVLLACSLALSFLIHPYYSFVGSFMVGFFLFVSGIVHRSKAIIVSGVAIPTIALLTDTMLVAVFDPLRKLRSSKILGLGFDDWEVTLGSMFTPYPFNTIRFFTQNNSYPFDYEVRAYMGTAVVIALVILLFSFFFKKNFRPFWKQARASRQFTLTLLLFVTSLFMIMLSFGEDFYILKTKHHFYNFFSPIYILRRTILPELGHIRYVSRFYFPVVFILYFGLAYLLIMLRNFDKIKFKVVATVILIALIADTFDTVGAQVSGFSNPFSPTSLNKIEIGKFNPKDFDAILPIPYFYVGSTEKQYTIETSEDYFDYTLKLSASSRLPLMSNKMSRTPEYQNHLLVDIFRNKKLSEEIYRLLKGKKILTVYHKQLNEQYAALNPQMDNIADVVKKNGSTLPQEFEMEKISESENLIFYKWVIR